MKNNNFILACGLMLLAAVSRFIPHPPNFTAVMAMSIFAGILFNDKKFAFIIPLGAMLITDAFLGFHSGIPFVYLSLIIGTLTGFLLKKNLKFKRVLAYSLFNSVQFYLITNFGFWLLGGFYPLTPTGLMDAYIMGLPFFSHSPLGLFGWTLAGDLLFSSSFYGIILLADKYAPKLAK